MQGKIICKSVDCDVWRAFNFKTTLYLQETNVKATYACKIAKNTSENTSTQLMYKVPLFSLWKRERKRMKQAVKLMSQILFYSEVQIPFIRLKNNIHESVT